MLPKSDDHLPCQIRPDGRNELSDDSFDRTGIVDGSSAPIRELLIEIEFDQLIRLREMEGKVINPKEKKRGIGDVYLFEERRGYNYVCAYLRQAISMT